PENVVIGREKGDGQKIANVAIADVGNSIRSEDVPEINRNLISGSLYCLSRTSLLSRNLWLMIVIISNNHVSIFLMNSMNIFHQLMDRKKQKLGQKTMWMLTLDDFIVYLVDDTQKTFAKTYGQGIYPKE
ncbi:hypothetical protein ACJX0J_024457, partial [Zea mays]